MMKKKILYVDMDGVLVDFQSGIDQLSEKTKQEFENRLDEVPGIFKTMKPIKSGIGAIRELSAYYDIYILSTAPWNNPSAWNDKLQWVQKYLPEIGYKRLILSHHKNLNKGDYLIDDREANGVGEFEGHHIFFGRDKYKDWMSVYNSLLRAYISSRTNLDSDIENALIDKAKENKNGEATDQLYQCHKPMLEVITLQYNDDLDSKEHKILQSKAKEAYLNAIIRYDRERGFKLITYAVYFIRDAILDYLSKRDGFKRLPKCRIGKINNPNSPKEIERIAMIKKELDKIR